MAPLHETYGAQEKNLAEAIVDEQLQRGVAVESKPWLFFNHGSSASGCLKAAPGALHSFYVANLSTTETYFLQFFNQINPAATGDIPALAGFELQPKSYLEVGAGLFGEKGVTFPAGITYGFSTNRDTYMAGTSTNLRATFGVE